MNDVDGLYEMVYPRPRTLDYLKLVALTGAMMLVTCTASWAAANGLGAPILLAPVVPTATFVALLARADLPALPEGGHSPLFLAMVAAMLYAGGALCATA